MWPRRCCGIGLIAGTSKKLKDRDDYRLRVGRYRLIFSIIDQKPRIIRIEEVKIRDDRTY